MQANTMEAIIAEESPICYDNINIIASYLKFKLIDLKVGPNGFGQHCVKHHSHVEPIECENCHRHYEPDMGPRQGDGCAAWFNIHTITGKPIVTAGYLSCFDTCQYLGIEGIPTKGNCCDQCIHELILADKLKFYRDGVW